MNTIRHILMPTDFSDVSRDAFPYALAIAQQYGAGITILHAVSLYEYDPNNPQHTFDSFEDVYKTIEDTAHTEVRGMVESAAKSHQKIKIASITERGVSPHEVITSYAGEHGIDLIVMATHGRSGLSHLLIGSVTEKVIQRAPCSVLAVRRPKHHPVAQTNLKRILVPTDFSDGSGKAMEQAIVLARRFDAGILALHAVEIRFHPAYYAGGAESIFDLDPDMRGRIEARLEAYVKGFDLSGIDVQTTVREGSSHIEIVKAASEENSDLIVMSTRGHDEIADYLIGSTTDRVLKRTPCPVLVTR